MKLIVGLGNPGPQYTLTRHNIGFLAIDEIQKSLNLPPLKPEPKFKSELTKGSLDETQIILAKPTTFMNLSGEAIQKIASFYKISPEEIIVIYDDIDLPFEKIRIRTQGGPGTHNGLKSITQHIGQNFPRIRIGIESRGDTAPQQQSLHDFVLSNFTSPEETQLPTILKKATQATQTILQQGITEAMNKFN